MVLCVPYMTALTSHLSNSCLFGLGLNSTWLLVDGNKFRMTVAAVGYNCPEWADVGIGHMGSAEATMSQSSLGNTQHYARQISHNWVNILMLGQVNGICPYMAAMVTDRHTWGCPHGATNVAFGADYLIFFEFPTSMAIYT